MLWSKLLKFFGIYLVVLCVGAIVYTATGGSGGTKTQEPNTVDYIVMVPMAPIFMGHRLYRYMINYNWEYFFTELLPSVVRYLLTPVYDLCVWCFSLISDFIEKLFSFWYRIIDTLVLSTVRRFVRYIQWIATSIYSIVTGVIDFVVEVFSKIDWELIYSKLVQYFKTTVNVVSQIVEVVYRFVRKLVVPIATSVYNLIATILTYIWRFLTNTLITRLFEFVKHVLSNLVSYVKYLWSVIYDWLIYPICLHLIYNPCMRIWSLLLIVYNQIAHVLGVLWSKVYINFWKMYDSYLWLYNDLSTKMVTLWIQFQTRFWKMYDSFWIKLSNLNEKFWRWSVTDTPIKNHTD